MDEKTARMAERLRKNPAALKSLMQSQDGQALMRMLTEEDQGAGLRQAVQSAAAGDTTAVARMVSRIMQSPEGAELVERINRAAQR